MPTRSAKRSLHRAIRGIAISFGEAAAPDGAAGSWPDPQAAARGRRCVHASTNELFTDIAGAAPAPPRPRLRLCVEPARDEPVTASAPR